MNFNMILQGHEEEWAVAKYPGTASLKRFLTAAFLALGCLIMSAPAALADCPPGYLNGGITCTQPAEVKGNPSRVADCPAGYTNTGLTCTRPGSTIASGGSRPADCPSGYTNIGSTCNDGLFKIKTMSEMTCHADEFRNGVRCYKSCPAGYTSTGATCTRPPDTVGSSKMTCNAGEFGSIGRCYKLCPTGYTSSGETCTRNPVTLPQNADIAWNAPASVAGKPVYNIAHMVTTDAAVDWAVSQGANGLEMDLHFNPLNGDLTEFRHGGSCDCSCAVNPGPDHVCHYLNNSCETSAPVSSHLLHISTKTGVGLVYIDSKLADLDSNMVVNTAANAKARQTTQQFAGFNVVNALSVYLFKTGYKGIAMISAPSTKYLPYLVAAVDAASRSAYKNRIFFAIDMDNGSRSGAESTIAQLKSLGTPNIVYASGLTSCVTRTYYSETTAGVKAQVANPSAARLTSVWSIDLEQSMIDYLNIGARGIVTNRPGVLTSVLKGRYTLAQPSSIP